MPSFHKLHVVNFSCSLDPSKAELVRELHAMAQSLVSSFYELVNCKFGIVTEADKALLLQDGQFVRIFIVVIVVVFQIWRIEISLVVVAISRTDTKNRVFAWGPLQVAAAPRVLWTVTLANTVKPSIQRLVVPLDTVVGGRYKFVGIEVLAYTLLPAGTNRLLSRFAPCKHFYVDHSMFLWAKFFVIVNCTVKNQVAWHHLFELQIDWQRIVLICLIPPVKFEAKIFTQVIDDLANEGAAVEKNRCVIEGVAWVVIAFCVGNSKVLDASINKFLSELLLEVGIAPISGLFRHIVSILHFFNLCFAETFKILLEPSSVNS